MTTETSNHPIDRRTKADLRALIAELEADNTSKAKACQKMYKERVEAIEDKQYWSDYAGETFEAYTSACQTVILLAEALRYERRKHAKLLKKRRRDADIRLQEWLK
jgi:alkyl sulfatase BDS1-like metallo-beta-lactamase superfamily hydrolase